MILGKKQIAKKIWYVVSKKWTEIPVGILRTRFLLMLNIIISAITYLMIQISLYFYTFLINTLPRHQTIFWSRFWNNFSESAGFPYQLTPVLETKQSVANNLIKKETKLLAPFYLITYSQMVTCQCWQGEMRLTVDWLENALAIGQCSEAMQQVALVLITFSYTHFLWHKQNKLWFIFDGSSPHQF